MFIFNCLLSGHLLLLCCTRYGFQGKPRLDLSAKPKLGQREVTLHYVTEWIENKLKELLEVSVIQFNGDHFD